MIVPVEYEHTQDARKASHKDREFERAIRRERSEKIKNAISQKRSERRENLRQERNDRAEQKRLAEEAEAKRLADLESTDWTKHKETAFARGEENIESEQVSKKMLVSCDMTRNRLRVTRKAHGFVHTVRLRVDFSFRSTNERVLLSRYGFVVVLLEGPLSLENASLSRVSSFIFLSLSCFSYCPHTGVFVSSVLQKGRFQIERGFHFLFSSRYVLEEEEKVDNRVVAFDGGVSTSSDEEEEQEFHDSGYYQQQQGYGQGYGHHQDGYSQQQGYDHHQQQYQQGNAHYYEDGAAYENDGDGEYWV